MANVRLVHLNMDNSYPPDNTIATYLGWGMVNTIGEVSSILREVDVAVMTNEECNLVSGTIYNIYFSLSGMVTPSMMCTFTKGKDSCQRDSGGPLIVRGKDASRDIQIGVSSWGVSCASDTFPGVVSRVSYSWQFIRENVCNKSSIPPDYFECSTIGEPLAPSSSKPSSSLSPSIKLTSESVEQIPSASPIPSSNAQKSISNIIVALLAMSICLFLLCQSLTALLI